MMHIPYKSKFKKVWSMDSLQQRSVPFCAITANSSSCGTPSESGDSHEIKFTHKEGCTPTACACVILAVLFVSLGAAAGVYFGLQFLDLEKRNERVYKGSFVVLDGDKYSTSLSDTLSGDFMQKASLYRTKLEKLYNNSIYKDAFVQAEVLALNRREEDKKLTVHFNLHLSPEQAGISAADLYVILAEEVMKSHSEIFTDLDIDQDSIQIQERKPHADDAFDRWVPRRQYPGYLEGLTTTPSSDLEGLKPRRCSPIEVPFCTNLAYNTTSYPNIVGHQNSSEVSHDLVTFRQIIDFECYPLAHEFVCQLLQPDCKHNAIIMPCKEFCEDFWKACKRLLPKKVSEKFDCTKFPKFSGGENCRQKPGCTNELKARGMADRLCDGIVDCIDLSDESDCDYCRQGQFFCGGHQCVDKNRRCDERDDCLNGADERNCLAIAGSNWSARETSYRYSKSGFLVHTSSAETARVCSENLNNSLPENRRDVVLQSLAVSTCSALNYEVTEAVDMRSDNRTKYSDFVQLLDPLASTVTFAQATCDSQQSVYVRCGTAKCGLRPAYSATVAKMPKKTLIQVENAAEHGQWPWYAALFKNGEHVCDAALISEEWLLTSIACFDGNSYNVWSARIGLVRLTSNSPFDQETRIIGMVKSPIANGAVVLVKLQVPLNGSDYVRPACLPSHNYFNSTKLHCVTMRWDIKKTHLHQIPVKIKAEATCSLSPDVRASSSSLPSDSICTNSPKEKFSDCQGDEVPGRPLLCSINEKWYVVGVNSEKLTCSNSTENRIFHHTYEHVQWIRHTFESLRSQ